MARPEYYAENRERVLAVEKLRYRRNRERIRKQQNAARKNWSEEQRLVVAAQQREYRANNRERQKANIKRWIREHPDQFRAIQSRYRSKVLATPMGQLNARMSKGIFESLRSGKQRRRWTDLVPYSLEELRRHIEKQFRPGMSWEALLRGDIHIDHVVPISKFTFASPEDIGFKRCWALENLAPEWAWVNESKNCRITRPTQIALGV